MNQIYYACGLHMHQPPDNLKLLIEHNEWEANQIIKCYERAAKYAHKHKNHYIQVDFSGILLEQFLDPYIIDKYRNFVDIPQMLEMYKSAANIEIIGMGFFHPIFPLIPTEDWQEQLEMGNEIFKKTFNIKPTGFWPSEMAFSMELIPALVKAGYEYVVVDHVHVKALNKKDNELTDCFKPYLAEYNGATITIIPRNRDMSNAQESGMNPEWFLGELPNKLNQYPSNEKQRLVTTWSDGENGGWFRQIDENAGFFGYFYESLLKRIDSKETNIKTIKISDYIKKYPAKEKAHVNTGAWNVASTSGFDFVQWYGSDSQKKACQELFGVSGQYWAIVNSKKKLSAKQKENLRIARRLILDAETSCYLFWGDAWIPKLYDKTNEAKKYLALSQ